MKKTFKFYIAAWAVVIALFNVISFVVPNERTTLFWIGYSFISLTFVGLLIFFFVGVKASNAAKMFYKFSLIKIGYGALIASFIVGGLCMAISPIPYWVGVVACAVVLAANILSILKATVAVTEIERIDSKIKTQTAFVKILTIDAEALMARANDDAIKAECRKVCEAVRYSDPMSNGALASVEGQITLKFAELSESVSANDKEKVASDAKELLVLIDSRNKKCMLLK